MQASGDIRLAIDRDGIAAIEPLIRRYLRHTPTITVDAADFGLTAAPLVFKLEFLQHTGSFKPRGAFANLLTRTAPAAGVVAASGGNHGAAVAYAAMRLGISAAIFVPEVTSAAKRERIRSYGAELVVSGASYAEALAASEERAAESGALPIHAYDQPETLLGQGTVGLELEADRPEIDTLLVAAGGGGLIGGIAADSLAPRRVGRLIFPIAQQHVAAAVLVGDDAIRAAQRRLWELLRIAAEPGGAAALAALLARRYRPRPGERVAVLLCSANTSAVDFGRLRAIDSGSPRTAR